MQCPNCGCDLKPGTSFCFNCGYYLDDIENSDDSNSDEIETESEIDDSVVDFSENAKSNNKKKFNIKDNIVYIVLGTILLFSLILLIYGIATRNSGGNNTQPVETPTVKKSTTVEVNNYKLTVPAGLDYQIEGKNIFISDDSSYNFSFRINDGNYDLYSKDIDALSEQLKNNGYEITESEKKTIDDAELLIYTMSMDSDTKYLYMTKASSEKIAMGVISIHNSKSIDSICKVILKVVDSVEFDSSSSSEDSSGSSGGVEDSSGTNVSASIVKGLELLLN